MPSLLSEDASKQIAVEVIEMAQQIAQKMVQRQNNRPMNRADTVDYANIDQKDFDELITRGGLQAVKVSRTKRRYLPKDVDAALERMKEF